MKKFITLFLLIAFVVSLSACSYELVKKTEPTTAPTEEEAPSETTASPTTENSSTTEPAPVESTIPVTPTESESTGNTQPTETVPTEEPSIETEPTEVQPSNGNVDISGAAATTSIEAPANAGQWVKTAIHNPVSGEYETAYWRIVSTTFDCQSEIDRYNSEERLFAWDFSPLESDIMSYCMVTYEVYLPEDFSSNDWGLSSSVAQLGIRAKGADGNNIEWQGVSYIGMGSCYDITERYEDNLYPGDVYTGKCVYVMINDPDVEYIFEFYHRGLGVDAEYTYDYSKAK